MMSKSYSVMWDPVISVEFCDGSLREIGIREAFVRAHEIIDLRCDSPLERYAVFRLLVAIAMDMFRPEKWRDRKKLLIAGLFDAAVIDAYIAVCETDGPRFDLFDPKHPFMQAAYDPAMDEKALKPVAALSVSLPSGNNHVFLDHRPVSVPVMTPSEAFRTMITLYVFCTAAAQGYPSGINNTPPVYSQVMGKTLFETIVLNMSSTLEHPNLEDGYDRLPWRSNTSVVPKQEYASVTMMEAMTWQPRRITLMQDEDGLIRNIALQQGKNFRGDDVWRDPHVTYRCSKKGEWNSIKPQSGRALWRDIGTLLADSTGTHCHPPAVINRAGDLLDEIVTPLVIQQVGLITNQASYVSWIEDRLSLPICILEDDLLASIIRNDTEAVEIMQSALAQCINARYSHDKKHGADLAEQARMHFLSQMHDVLFGFSIPDVYRNKNDFTHEIMKEHIHQFNGKMETAIKNTLTQVVQPSGSTAKDLQLQVDTQREVINRFRKYAREREERNE